jgi:hypothetical protein
MWGRLVLLLGAALVLGACTTVDMARAPSARGGRDVFVSTADMPGPYKSLGVVQATRRGVLLFGFADPAGTDLQANLDEQLLPNEATISGEVVKLESGAAAPGAGAASTAPASPL